MFINLLLLLQLLLWFYFLITFFYQYLLFLNQCLRFHWFITNEIAPTQISDIVVLVTDDDEERTTEELLELLKEQDAYDAEEEEENNSEEGVAMFVQSRKGRTILQYNGHRYRKTYRSKHGIRWVCSVNKQCCAFVYLNDNDEIIMANQEHNHTPTRVETIDEDQNDTAIVITSRKGREMLLFRHYTYRKQYHKGNKARWVCSTMKNCRGCVFTDGENFITSTFEEHRHSPPKYYLKQENVLEALREPLTQECD
ncbi:uncharacterized protein LOC106130133 [Amyelois transitella]|uniref:uncharacterized protein LOC106130133 n=1 Tax=Amyelois transitella TaxID=680683 RepID=UPI0029901DF1|nr:uncharacterized protein LOC106130133 [Amyelois transitella]